MQNWTVVFELSAIPTIFVLYRILRSKSSEASTSRKYYSATLILLIVWNLLGFTSANLPPDQEFLTGLVIRLTFLLVSVTVYAFVLSSIYFTRRPRTLETALVASPIIMILIAFIIDPFSVTYTEFGWYGDMASPTVRYTWLALTVLIVAYACVRLFGLRARIQDREAKRRMTYFASSDVLALVVAVVLYLLSQVAILPVVSSIGVNFSVLLAYPAFAPMRHESTR